MRERFANYAVCGLSVQHLYYLHKNPSAGPTYIYLLLPYSILYTYLLGGRERERDHCIKYYPSSPLHPITLLKLHGFADKSLAVLVSHLRVCWVMSADAWSPLQILCCFTR